MAKDLTGTTAATERFNDTYRVVWLVEIDADAPDVATTVIRYGSRKYTLGADTYTDELAPDGLQISWNRLRVGGGLAAVASVQFRVRNEDQESDNMDTYFLENDEVRVYLVFVTGAETASDKILMQQGVIEDLPFTLRTWDFDVIDGSDKDFSTMPKKRVDLQAYPLAPLGSYGKVIPIAFGALNRTPDDDAGSRGAMAPCRALDGFAFQFTSGEQNDVYGQPYQYYARAQRYGKISNYTQTGSAFTIDDAERIMRLGPVLPGAGNDRTTWYDAADGDNSTSVTVEAAQNLDVFIGGTPKLGTIVSAKVQINAGGGNYGYDILYDGASIFSNASVTGDQSITLTDAPTDHADDWDFELYEVRIDGSAGDPTIEQIYLEITYDDQLTQERSELTVFQAVTGWEDQTTYLRDGSVINSDGAALVSAPHILAAVLRGKQAMNLQAASVNLTAVSAAQTDRSDWQPAVSINEEINIEWLNEFGFQMGMHVFKDYNGRWKMVAQEKSREPAHTFLTNTHIAVRNPNDPPNQWEPDIVFSRTPVRDLINEVALKYGKDHGTGEYTQLKVASGRYRVTASDGVVAQTSPSTKGTLTSASSTFQTDGVAVNDTVYIKGDKEYTVDSVDSETQVTMTASEGDVNAGSSKTFYIGPNVSGEMVRSQNRYKTENALGRKMENFTDQGGYASDFIQDDTTAQNFVTHIEEWRSQRRVLVEFATFLNAVDVELGDFAWFDHTWLPTSKRPVTLGSINSGINATVTTADTDEISLIRVDDHLLIGSEVIKVTAANYAGTDFQFTRAQANTVAASHAADASFQRLDVVRFEVIGVQPDVARQQIRLQLQETPPAYKPVGVVVATGYPDWDSATPAQRTQAGWATLLSGRVKDDDEYSAVSWIGPDTGTYP